MPLSRRPLPGKALPARPDHARTKEPLAGLKLRPVSDEILRATLRLFSDKAPGAISKKFLADHLGVTNRTVEGALNALVAQGAELGEGWSQEGSRRVKTWTLLEAPDWDETLNSEARLALEVVVSALGNGLAGAWREHLDEIQTLVEGKLTPRELTAFENLKGKVLIRGARQSHPLRAGVLSTVLTCLGGSSPRKLSLRYAAASTGREEEIAVVPWCLLHDVFTGGAFLLCWDLNRGNPGMLRLNRILEAVAAGAAALTARERALLDRCGRYQIGGFISTEDPEELQVRVSGNLWVRAFLEQPPGLPEVSVTEEEAGTVLVRFRASEYRAPARWVLQMGPDAEAIAPAEFRSYVARRAENTAGKYTA